VLFCLVSFWKNPQDYEDLESIGRECLGLDLPRVVPFLDRPCFLYFERGWTPRLQELSYKNPVLWPLTADGADLTYTLTPFVQGMHGGEREQPREPLWKRGFGKTMAYSVAFMLAVIILFIPVVTVHLLGQYVIGAFVSSPSSPDDRQIPELVARSPRITLEGRAVRYRFTVPEALVKQVSDNELVEHSLESPDGHLSIQTLANKGTEDLSTLAHRLLINTGNQIVENKLENVRTINQGGADWNEIQIMKKMKNGVALKQTIRAMSDARGTVIVIATAKAAVDPIYSRILEEIFQSVRFVEEPRPPVESARAVPKVAPLAKAPPARVAPLAKAPPAKRAGRRPDAGAIIVRGSDLKGPAWNTQHPRGHYVSGAEKVRFLFGAGSMAPEAGKSLPAWPDVANYADQVDGDLHVSGDAFHYILLERRTLLVLKFVNITRDWDGYVVVYRAPDGSYYYTSNGDDKPWKPLPKGEAVDIDWNEADNVQVHIEIVRPNLNEDEKDREVDYRFRLVEVPSTPR
jgi:hypothetical protein